MRRFFFANFMRNINLQNFSSCLRVDNIKTTRRMSVSWLIAPFHFSPRSTGKYHEKCKITIPRKMGNAASHSVSSIFSRTKNISNWKRCDAAHLHLRVALPRCLLPVASTAWSKNGYIRGHNWRESLWTAWEKTVCCYCL